jgi:hypothetical protein
VGGLSMPDDGDRLQPTRQVRGWLCRRCARRSTPGSRLLGVALLMLSPGTGTALSIGLHGQAGSTVVAVTAVITSGVVAVICTVTWNIPAILRARSIAAVNRAVIEGKLKALQAAELINADTRPTSGE